MIIAQRIYISLLIITTSIIAIPDNQRKNLAEAIRAGENQKIFSYLKSKPKELNPVIQKGEQSTLLHMAAKYGNEDIINKMRQYDVDPNIINNQGLTPLHLAANHKHTNAVKALIQYNNINPNATGNLGITPIEVALYKAGVAEGKSLWEIAWEMLGGSSKKIEPVSQDIVDVVSEILKHSKTNASIIPIEKYKKNKATQLIRDHIQESQYIGELLKQTALQIHDLYESI